MSSYDGLDTPLFALSCGWNERLTRPQLGLGDRGELVELHQEVRFLQFCSVTFALKRR